MDEVRQVGGFSYEKYSQVGGFTLNKVLAHLWFWPGQSNRIVMGFSSIQNVGKLVDFD